MLGAILSGAVAGAGTAFGFFTYGGKFKGKTDNALMFGFAAFLIVFAIISSLSSSAPAPGGAKKKKKKSKSVKATPKTEAAPAAKAKTAAPAAPAAKKEKKATPVVSKKAAGGKKAKKEAEVPKPKAKQPKKKASKADKKPQKEELEPMADSDDEFSLEALSRGPKKAAVKKGGLGKFVVDSDSEDDFASAGATSKSTLRRRKQKEKKEAAFASTSFHAAPQVDDQGFETVVKKKRHQRKPAKAVVAEVVKPTGSDVSEEMAVEPRLFGVLIGPQGATLKAHEEACGVRINIPERESEKRTITITGPASSIADCKRHLKQLISKGYSSVTNPDMTSVTVVVQQKQMGIVIGPKGATIKTLQEKCNVRIKTEDTKVVISGLQDDVQSARSALKNLLEHGFSSVTHAGWVSKEVDFPRDEFGTLIGPGGQNIRSIQGDTKCRINIPDVDDANQNVVVVGEGVQVERAIKQIQNLLAKKEAADAQRALAQDEDEDSDGGFSL